MATSIQGCCAEALHSVGQGCDLNAIALTDIFTFSRFRNGLRAGLPTNPATTSPNTIGEEIQEQVAQTSTGFNYVYPIPRPTQILFVPSDETSNADPVGFEQVNGGGDINMVTVTWTGDKATSLLKLNIDRMFKGCGDVDVVFGDDNGALVGVKKLLNDELLFGYQVVRSTVKTKFEQAGIGSTVNTLTLMFQVRKEPKNSSYMAIIPSDVLGYSADELEALRLFTGRLEVVSATVLNVQFIGDAADATKKLYLQGFTGASPQVLTLRNLTTGTDTTLLAAAIVENVVPDSQVTNTVGTNYTVTITAQTAFDEIQLIASGVAGYETIVSNIATAL